MLVFSSKIDEQLLLSLTKKLLNENYLIKVNRLEIVTKGVNYTFRILSSDVNYYFKVFSAERTVPDIEFEISATKFLVANGVKVAPIVISAGGSPYIEACFASERRLAILYQDIGGRPLLNNTADILCFSKALAELHKFALSDFTYKNLRKFCLNSEIERLHKTLNSTLIPVQFSIKAKEACKKISDSIVQENMALNHGDAWLGNSRIVNNSIFFLDLEDSLFAERLFDLGVMAYHLIAKECQVSHAIDSMLAGYNEGASHSATLASIKPYIQLRSINAFCFLIEKKLVSEQLLPKLLARTEYFIGEKFDSEIEKWDEQASNTSR